MADDFLFLLNEKSCHVRIIKIKANIKGSILPGSGEARPGTTQASVAKAEWGAIG